MFLSDPSSGIYWDVIANAVVIANAFLVGSWVLAKLVSLDEENFEGLGFAEWVFVGTTLGLGLIAWITLPLGLLLPYDPLLYRCGHAVLLLACGFGWMRSAQAKKIRLLSGPPWRDVRLPEKTLWLVIGLTCLYAIFLSLHSIGGSDGQTLHLKAVSIWQESRRYVPMVTGYEGLPHTVGDEQTQSGKLLYLQVALLGNISAAGAFNIMLVVLGCVGIYALGSLWFSPTTGVLAVLVYLTNPVIFRYYLWDVTDYPLNLDVFLALCVALTIALRSLRQRWLVIAAVLAGLLYGIKSYSVLQIALLALIALPFLYRRGWLWAGIKLIPLLALFASPWLIHHWIVFGNPVWPHMNPFFGGRPLSPLWLLFTQTRPYFQLQPYFEAGCATYGSALMRFWRDQLFPPKESYFLFSLLLVPSIGMFAIAAWWRRVFIIPLIFAVGFLAVTLSTPQLFNKYMILIAAPTAPFLAAIVQRILGRREIWLSCVSVGLGIYVLLMAWDAIALYNRNGEMFTHAASALSAEPQRTLNNLPEKAVVFGNFVGMDNRYTRIYWHFHHLSDTSELLCDDWNKLWAFYKARGVTHYLVQTNEYNEFYYASVLPYVDKYDPPLGDYIRKRQAIFERNKKERDQYLAANGRLVSLGGGYLLYELH